MVASTGATRRDAIWQRNDVTASYQHSRRGIPFAAEQIDLMLRLLDAHRVKVMSLLDLGAGDGFAAAAVMDHHPVERTVLIDFSEPMLELAQSRFSDSAVDVHFFSADLATPGWSSTAEPLGPFDAVVSRFAIHHLQDNSKQEVYTQAFNLLRPGGVFVNIEHVKSFCDAYETTFQCLMIEGIHSLDPDGASLDEIESAFHARQDRETNVLSSVEEQCAWLRSIGFVDVDCGFKFLELAVLVARKP